MTGETIGASMTDPAAAPHGWTCFHCNETFTQEAAAADHFGTDLSAKAACVLRLQDDERGILTALRRAERELKENRRALEELDHEASSYHQQSAQLERLFGANSAYGAWLVFDSMEGRALAAEAIITAAENIDAKVIAAARVAVCGPEPVTPVEEVNPLVAFFRGEGQAFGLEGDSMGWSPERTAIEAMRKLIKKHAGNHDWDDEGYCKKCRQGPWDGLPNDLLKECKGKP